MPGFQKSTDIIYMIGTVCRFEPLCRERHYSKTRGNITNVQVRACNGPGQRKVKKICWLLLYTCLCANIMQISFVNSTITKLFILFSSGVWFTKEVGKNYFLPFFLYPFHNFISSPLSYVAFLSLLFPHPAISHMIKQFSCPYSPIPLSPFLLSSILISHSLHLSALYLFCCPLFDVKQFPQPPLRTFNSFKCCNEVSSVLGSLPDNSHIWQNGDFRHHVLKHNEFQLCMRVIGKFPD